MKYSIDIRPILTTPVPGAYIRMHRVLKSKNDKGPVLLQVQGLYIIDIVVCEITLASR